MNRPTNMKSFLYIGVMFGCLTGCGGGGDFNDYPDVTGTVTLDGQPLTTGHVSFQSDSGGTGIGVLDSNGKYSARTSRNQAGLKPGEYKISVTSWKEKPGIDKDGNPDMSVKGVSMLHKSYADTKKSGLTASVTESGPNEFNFELKAAGP
ncbi:carboxypeptidase-like regulatory domain-containing protein [Gimesia aquarii]|uniref:Carboxypeptidase regulatory-like domain-containing protein n=1 Tax=Gimesia aquarii TaxID=2527964 RepID=A0A517WY50_9PLAN|nr:carboxypeptidase-like regulatory domain-containing protein [Gimesia aquarii]QDU10187.1 hypothetical protein V202x_35860 [Gimesia aquarii]